MSQISENKELSIISDNITDLSARRDIISKQVRISFQMLAQALKDDLQSYKEAVAEHCKGASPQDVVCFFGALAQNTDIPLSSISMLEGRFERFENKAEEKVAYLKNNYTNSAFLKFSKIVRSPKAIYKPSFDEVCEAVYNGSCDYCILPIESIANGKLFGFYSLIDKYDLKIFAVCDIDEKHSSNRTRYALLSRKILITTQKDHKSYLEFSLIDDSADALADIMSAAHHCSLGLYRVDSISVPYDDTTLKFYHIFDSSDSALVPFLMYLDIKHPSCKIVGNYIYIN